MIKTSFTDKNNLIIRHKNAEYFSKDLELFKQHYPGHSLNNDLSKANRFSYLRLDGQMIGLLLDKVSIDEILENRNKEAPTEPVQRSEDEIKALLVSHFAFDEKDLFPLSEIIPLWATKSDEEIISAVNTLLGENQKDDTDGLDLQGKEELSTSDDLNDTDTHVDNGDSDLETETVESSEPIPTGDGNQEPHEGDNDTSTSISSISPEAVNDAITDKKKGAKGKNSQT